MIDYYSYNDFKHFEVIAPTTSIANGQLAIGENPEWSLVLHELCHILVVEPKYRYMINGSTVRSYKKINLKYPDNKKYRTESCTIGLQDIIAKQYKLSMYISGSFFKGSIGVNSLIDNEWLSRGKFIFDNITIDYNKTICNEYNIKNRHDIPIDNSNILIITKDNKIFNCIYKNNKYINSMNIYIDTSSIKYWHYSI